MIPQDRERRPPSSLTDDEIRVVYRLAHLNGRLSQIEIANLFNISRLVVSRIARGLAVR